MDLPVVVAAQKQSVGQVGRAASRPGHQVVGVGVGGRSATPGAPAPGVAGGKGSALGGREHAHGAPEIERDAGRVEQQSPDGGVAHEAGGGLGGEPDRRGGGA
jgi:hypothetical protein